MINLCVNVLYSAIECSDDIKKEIKGQLTSFLEQIVKSGCKDDFQIGIEARL